MNAIRKLSLRATAKQSKPSRLLRAIALAMTFACNHIYCKGLFPLLLYVSLSLSFIPSLILAEGTDTSSTSIEESTHQTETSPGNNEKNTPDLSADVKKVIGDSRGVEGSKEGRRGSHLDSRHYSFFVI